MNEHIAIILSITSYKIVSLIVGLCFAWMGYRLFMAGVWGHAGDVDAQLKDYKVVIKKAAPGTFFAAFGTVIIGFTVFKGIQFDYTQGAGTPTPLATQPSSVKSAQTPLPDSLPGMTRGVGR